MLVKMKYLSIEEMPIQHIHSKTRTQFFVTSIWRMFDSIHPELTQRYYFFFLSMLLLFLRHVLPQ